MSDGNITLALQTRTTLGKAVKGLRREGLVPAVIHDHGKDSVIVSAEYMPLFKAYQQAGKQQPVTLELGKQTWMAMIKDVDFEPRKHDLRHVVFNAIKQNETIETEVPIVLEGEIPAERASLIVLKTIDHITIQALPRDLIDSISVNAESLTEIGDKLTVADLIVPKGVTVMTEAEHTIAVVEEPAAHAAEEALEQAEESAAETAAAEEAMAAQADKDQDS